jgi:hypothetical protein
MDTMLDDVFNCIAFPKHNSIVLLEVLAAARLFIHKAPNCFAAVLKCEGSSGLLS